LPYRADSKLLSHLTSEKDNRPSLYDHPLNKRNFLTVYAGGKVRGDLVSSK